MAFIKLTPEKNEARKLARRNFRRVKVEGVDLIRDYNNVQVADSNFYTSDCQSVAYFRSEAQAV